MKALKIDIHFVDYNDNKDIWNRKNANENKKM